MNRKQRNANRRNAQALAHAARARHICQNCGENGLHWMAAPMTLAEMLSGDAEVGFWTCPALYGPDGRRIAA